uniref:F-box domain-containing protein n=1 Tax=Setaria viridis TaxID=4556 RepID=A0A4U6SQZ0_SETVI|nr:hypothetical protein SEVIR_9G034300v2 [Setaria viridis]
MPDADHGDGGVDLISNLPNDVLVCILRLVGDARQVVRTSALARAVARPLGARPRPPLRLGASDAQRFIAFVNNVLAQHAQPAGSGMEQMMVFLNLYYERGEPHLAATTVVEAAGGRIRYAVQHELTSFAFVVSAMTKKWLDMFYPEEEDDDQGEVVEEEEEEEDMPLIALDELLASSAKLKTMRLSLDGTRVRLPSTSLEIDSGDLLGRLLSPACCPRLQKLLMGAVTFKHASTKELVLETSTLLELTMWNMGEMESLELRTPNLRSFEVKYCYGLERLTMSASRLEQLTFSHNSYEVGIYLDVPCMGHLRINLVSHMRYDSNFPINDASISLLKSCTPATCLVVDLDVPTDLWERRANIITYKIPQHPNVTSLVVNIHTMRDRHFFGDGVAGLLTRFNNLRYLCLQLDEVPGCIKKDEYFSEDADGNLAFVCNHQDRWVFSEISLSNLIRAEFRGLTGTVCELRFLRSLLESAADLEKVIGWVDYFLNMVLEDGVWASNEDHSYEWRP